MKRWERQKCGCIKTELSIGKVLVVCSCHRKKKTKRTLCHFDDDGIVRLGA